MANNPTKKQKETLLQMTKQLNSLKLKLSKLVPRSVAYKMVDKLIDQAHKEVNQYRKKIGMKPLTRIK